MATNPNLQVTSTSVNNITDAVKELILKYDAMTAKLDALENSITVDPNSTLTKLTNKVNALTSTVNSLATKVNGFSTDDCAKKRDLTSLASTVANIQSSVSKLFS